MKKRIISAVLVLSICLSTICSLTFAGNKDDVGICPHHTEHTEFCGYAEAVDGHACEFVCDICNFIVVEWSWVDSDGIMLSGVDYGFESVDWVLGVPGEVGHDELMSLLPSEITAVLVSGREMTLPITWDIEHPVAYDLPAEMTEGYDGADLPYFYLYTAILPEGYALSEDAGQPEVLVQYEKLEILADQNDTEKLLAEFDFENSSDRLEDKSGNNVRATLNNGNTGNYVTDNGNTYLDLSGNNAYLSLPTGTLNDLTELTVEMRIRWSYSGTSGSKWAFFAAPNANAPDTGSYVAVVLGETGNEVKAQRQNGGWQNEYRLNTVKDWPTDNAWHDVKVVFGEYTNTLIIDGGDPITDTGSFLLSNCIGQNGILWFGGASWDNGNSGAPGQFFNGAIDNIKISGKTPPPMNTEPYIFTDAIDPEDTVVNFFDYWTDNNNGYSPTVSDYRAISSTTQAASGINKKHLLLFAGYYGLTGNIADNLNSVGGAGAWNAWTGDIQYGGASAAPFDPNNANVRNYKPYQDIVDRTMVKGTVGDTNISYPRLSKTTLNNLITTGTGNFDGSSGPWYGILQSGDGRDESLEYLFNPDMQHDGKASYPDVTGLFRMDSQGYYYYNSDESFAELNADLDFYQKGQTSGGITDGNHVTLFNEPWRYTGNDAADRTPTTNDPGQFFPFNHWTNLFNENGDTVTQEHTTLRDQAGNSEPLNHYFGMTVTTKFQQPKDGMISPSTEMSFTFSGDDDVWIFIDGVLVGDIGGIHLPDGIKINFATGNITYYALQVRNSAGGAIEPPREITHMNITIYEMFKKAGADKKTAWRNEGLDAQNNQKDPVTFENGSIHTLQFYYMERGNDVSNCSIKFNLEPALKDRIRKVNEDGESLNSAEFALYKADIKDPANFDKTLWHVADEFKRVNLIRDGITHRDNGYYDLVDTNGEPIDFTSYADNSYFILEETQTPQGYRLNKDIVLQYHSNTNTFTVVNKYETGAYASFVAKWVQREENVYFAQYDPTSGVITQGNDKINVNGNSALEKGLAIVVPVFKQTSEENLSGYFQRWLPMYGSNTLGWNTITDSYQSTAVSDNKEEYFVHDVALAAFLQITGKDYRDWYIKWNSETNRLSGDMENLPGDATRYVVNNETNADLNLVTLFISVDDLALLLDVNQSLPNDDARYEALREALINKINIKRAELEQAKNDDDPDITDEDVVKALLDDIIKDKNYTDGEPFRLMYTDGFMRYYRTALYVPNERRELRVRKIDGNTGEGYIYIDGAVFAIFDTPAHAKAYPGNAQYNSTQEALDALKAEQARGGTGIMSFGETSTVKLDNSNEYQKGLLIFREDEEGGKPGYAQINWPSDRTNATGNKVLWLKEIYSPDGYSRNENLVRIEVGDLAIYANATGYNSDGSILTDGYAKTHDGIRVYAALGKLTQTLVKYALNNNVDITLRDILITLQTGSAGNNGALLHETWKDSSNDTYDLHYGLYSDVLTSQYGQHAYEQELPVFVTTDNYIRIMPRQSQKDFGNSDADGYYANLKILLENQLRNEAIENAKKEKDKDELDQDEIASINKWVGEKVSKIIADLKALHSYDAKRDDLTGVDLDGLFGLMNIVEFSNDVIPVSLIISKEVRGNVPNDDEYEFDIMLIDTEEREKSDPENLIPGEYHAYLHPTNHQVFMYDQHGNMIQATDPINGEPIVNDDGSPVYKTRPCGPGDHTSDQNHVHLIVENDGTGLVKKMTAPNAAGSKLKLKDGESFVVVGLPQGAKFIITERIISPSGTKYRTVTELKNDMRPYPEDDGEYDYVKPEPGSEDPDTNPELTVTENGLTVSGFLQTARYAWYYQNPEAPDGTFPEDNTDLIDDIVIPAAEVKFINMIEFVLPNVGGNGTVIYWLSGIGLLSIAFVFLYLERRRSGDNRRTY